MKRHGRKSSSSIRKRNTENAHREQEEYWNASRRRRDENIGDVETPVAKQFFDRIRARTCVELGLSLFLSFFEPDMEHRKWTAIFPFNGARVFSCNAAPLQDGLNLTSLRPPSSDSCFALLRERMDKVVFIAKRWPVSCLKGCNGYCAGLMIVLVSFIFAKSSEWRNFTTELNLAGFLSSRASLLNIYIFTVHENRKGPGIVTWIIVYTTRI